MKLKVSILEKLKEEKEMDLELWNIKMVIFMKVIEKTILKQEKEKCSLKILEINTKEIKIIIK